MVRTLTWILVLVIVFVKSMKLMFPGVMAQRAMNSVTPMTVVLVTVRVMNLSTIFSGGTAPHSVRQIGLEEGLEERLDGGRARRTQR